MNIDDKTEEIIRERLRPFIQDFDGENRGNRLSKALITGFGDALENLIITIIREIRVNITQEIEKTKGE